MGSDSHTPGPWSSKKHGARYRIVDRQGITLAHVPIGYMDYAAGNARLIAAAPCMKEALEAASHALRSYQYGNASTELAKAIADKCDAALSRATKGGDDDEG